MIGASFTPALSTQAAITDGLVAHYDFESNNAGNDASGNRNHLTLRGSAESTNGIKGKGLALDGFSTLEPDDSGSTSTSSDFTWSIWFQTESEEAGALISNSGEGWQPGAKALFKGEGDFLGFDLGWVGAAEYEGSIQDGEWHHAVIVGSFPDDDPIGLFELYVDGNWVSEVEGETEEVADPEERWFRVGGGSPGGFDLEEDGEEFPEPNTFFGSIDEVRIYDRALEADEVTELLIDGLGELPAPSITNQPTSTQGILGRSLTLSAKASGLLLEYQWQKDGSDIDGATGPSLVINEVSAETAGDYKILISNQTASVSSAGATVTVVESWDPTIALAGYWDFESSANPGKDASGNGVDLENIGVFAAEGAKGKAIETGSDAFLRDSDDKLQLDTHGDFTWTAMIRGEGQGNILSKSDENWAPGNKGLFVRDTELGFDVGWIGAGGGGPDLTDNEWHHIAVTSQTVDGETTQNFYVDGNVVGSSSLPVLDQPDAGLFAIGYGSDDFPEIGDLGDQDTNSYVGLIDEVRVYRSALIQDDVVALMLDAGGSVTPPSITDHPTDTSVTRGRTARIRVTTAGTAPTYQWQKNGVDIPGATDATLKITNASDEDAGAYQVVVGSNFSDARLTSNAATLTVQAAPVFAGGELGHVASFLESYWTFDEAPNDIVKDQSPNAPQHDGELRGGAAITSGNQGFGGSGEALDTSAEENAHMLALQPELYNFNESFTWSIMVKIFEPAAEGEEAGAGIFARAPAETGHNHGSKVLYLNGDTLGFDTGWVGAVNSDEPNLSLDSWHHVAMVNDADEGVISVYLDGEPIVHNESGDPVEGLEFEVAEFPEDEEFEGGVVNTGFRVGDGAIGFFADPFPGIMDNAAVWSTALSPEDIALLAGGASPLPDIVPLANVAPFLESYWDFDTVDGEIVPDRSPNLPNHDGVLTGGAVITSGNQGFGNGGEALDTSAEENAHMAAMSPESYDFNSSFTWSAMVKIFEPAAEGEEAGAGILARAPAESGHNHGSKVLYLNGATLGFDTGWVGAVNSDEPELDLDTWHHVAMINDSEEGVISIYLDGYPIIHNESGEPVEGLEFDLAEFPEDEEFEGGFVNTGFRVGDGAIGFFADPFPGIIDNVGIWSTVLSGEDIALLASGASPLPDGMTAPATEPEPAPPTLPETPVIPLPPITLPPIPGQPVAPSLSFSVDGASLTIEFTGSLLSSETVNGTYSAVEGVQSPLVIDLGSTSGSRFYQVR